MSVAFGLMTAFLTTQFKADLPSVPPALKPGFDSITVKDGRAILGYLAGPETEGRGTGQPGYDIAAKFMADEFKKAGLKGGMPDGSFFQYNDFWRVGVKPESVRLFSAAANLTTNEIGVLQAGEIAARGQAVYLRLVGNSGDFLQGKNYAGKVVFLDNVANRRGVDRALQNAGAAAIITIEKDLSKPSWRGVARDPGAAEAPAARLSVTWETATKLVPSFAKLVMTQGDVQFGETGETVFLRAQQVVEKIKVANVVAVLEGSDPKLKSEYIGVGAHLDHLGRRGNVIYYGADDDGSGNTGLLQLARALGKNPVKPKRSIFFMAFYGEEMGLLGSRYLSDNSPVPLNKMIAEIQMDMIGRDSDGAQNGDPNRMDKAAENTDTIRLVGSKRISTRLDDLIQEENKHVGFRFKYDAEDVYTRSDHYNFARLGIPIAFFFSGFHPDYHQPSDTIEKINYDKIANTAKLVYLLMYRLSDETFPLTKNSK